MALASSPKGYAQHAAETVDALRAGDIGTIIVAGRAAELGAAADRVDLDAYAGVDVVDLLNTLLDRLSVPREGADR